MRGTGPYHAPRCASGFTSRARRGRYPARSGRTSAGSYRARGSRGPGAEAFRAFIDDRAAEHVQRKASERARRTKLRFMRAWRDVTRYEDRLRTARGRVATKHRIATLRGYLRAWSGFSKTEGLIEVAIERFAERRRGARTRAVLIEWFVTVCADRHEDNLAAAATRKFWSFKGRRPEGVVRRVARVVARSQSRRVLPRQGSQTHAAQVLPLLEESQTRRGATP